MKGSKKLYLLVVVMSVFIIGVGWYGTHELKTFNQHTQTLYLDRVLPLQHLTTIRFNYAHGILSVEQQLKNHTITIQKAENQIEQARDKIESNWNLYKLTYLTDEEKLEMQQTEVLMQQSDRLIENFQIEILKNHGDLQSKVIDKELYAAIQKIVVKLTKLIELQVKVGDEIRRESVDQYSITSRRFYMLIIFSLICAISVALYIISNIQKLIKDLKSSNNKIAEIGERYHSLLEHAGDSIFLLNEDTSFAEVNMSMCNLLGYSQEKFRLMKLVDIFAPGEIERLPIQLHTLFKKSTLLTERKWLKRDGTEVDIEINVRLLTDEKKYLCIARDITERKRIEEIVKESEKKYRNIFENAQDVFYQASIDGIILDVSPSLKNHLGYKREELIGKSVSIIYADQTKREKLVQALRKQGEFKEYEMTFISSTGEEVFISLDARLIYDNNGKPSHIDGMFRNITERKRMLAQLVENQEQLTLFIEHSPVSLAMCDTDMNYIAASQRWLTDYKLDTLQINGKTLYETLPEMKERWQEIHKRCLNNTIEKMDEDSFIRADGTTEWLRWEIHPWHKATGEVGGIIMFTEFITERKKAELELENTLQQLEIRVQERTKELSDKNINILDSIKYAKRIQVGLLTSPSELKRIFPKSFMISLPCDIVSGDFFWSYERGMKKFIIVADCTGHGVPGALMSVICNNLIDQIIVNEGIEDPSKILQQLDERLKQAVKGDEGEVKDGMDLTLCIVDSQLNELSVAGANNSLYVTTPQNVVQEIHTNHVAIGGTMLENKKHFDTKKIHFFPGQRIYLSSDGYYSQFGGAKGKKFMKSNFTNTLTAIQQQPFEKQKQQLMDVFSEWKGNNLQVDDVLVVGIEL